MDDLAKAGVRAQHYEEPPARQNLVTTGPEWDEKARTPALRLRNRKKHVFTNSSTYAGA